MSETAGLSWRNLVFQHAGLSSTQPENTSPGALGERQEGKKVKALGNSKSKEQEAVKKADRALREHRKKDQP